MEFVSRKPNDPISEQAYREAAEDIGCDVAAVKAVAQVESAGGGYFGDGRPKILFERHWFRKLTANRFDASNPKVSGPRGGYRRGAAEYTRLEEAIGLDRDAALQSASWGKFQIMGFNHGVCGFDDVEDYVAAMVESEDRHLQAFISFVESKGLDRHLRSLDWAKFARGYNGPAYRENKYDTKMANAYAKFARQDRPAAVGEGAGAFTVATVEDAQKALTVLNFDPKGIDNKLGKNTREAIRRFQRSVHLPETGEFNSELRAALQTAYYMHQQYGSAEVLAG